MADDKYTRLIEIDDADLLALVQEKGQLVEQGRALSREQEALAQQHEKLGNEVSRIADKINGIKRRIFKKVEKHARKQLGEFEIPITTDVRDGKLVLLVSDALEEFKDSFKGFDKFREPMPKKKLAAKQ